MVMLTVHLFRWIELHRVLLSQTGRALTGLPHHHMQTTPILFKLQFKLALTWLADTFKRNDIWDWIQVIILVAIANAGLLKWTKVNLLKLGSVFLCFSGYGPFQLYWVYWWSYLPSQEECHHNRSHWWCCGKDFVCQVQHGPVWKPFGWFQPSQWAWEPG